LNNSENVNKKDKENEKKKLAKGFLEEMNIKLEKNKTFENFNFFEPLIHQSEFLVMKPITIFVFTAVDEVRNIFNKDSAEEYTQLLSKKEEVLSMKKEGKQDFDQEEIKI